MIRDFGVPRPPDEVRRDAEGTAAHYYVTQALESHVLAEGDTDPAGTPIDGDMIFHGDRLINAVLPYLNNARYDVYVERRFFTSQTIHTDVWGTPDIVIIDREERKILIFDYKYGYRIVDEYCNDQLTIYAIAVIVTLGLRFDDWTVAITIHQPRAYHPRGEMRTWDVPAGYLAERAAILKVSAGLARYQLQREGPPSGEARAGPWCRDCANHACSTFRASAYNAVATASELYPGVVRPEVAHLVLRQWRAAAQTLKHAIAGLEGDLLARTARGDSLPGIERTWKTTRRRWNVPVEVVLAIGAGSGVDLKKADAVTPAQAEKLGVDASVISSISEKPPGEAVLSLVDESAVRKAFG